MGWTPQPRWDDTNQHWRVHLRGKSVYLGGKNTPYVEVLATFAREYAAAYGKQPPKSDAPEHVDELIIAWLVAHGQWHEPEPKYWPKKDRWKRDCFDKFGKFCEDGAIRSIGKLKPDIIRRFTEHCQSKGWTAWSCRHYITAAKQLLKWGRKQGYLTVEPDDVKMPRAGYVPKDISQRSLHDIFKDIEAQPRLKRAGDLFKFCLMAGCRPGEARLLQWRHVRFEQSIAVLIQSEHKTGHSTGETRTIHLSPEALEHLRGLRRDGAKPSDYIFTSRLGKPYTRDGFSSIMQRLGTFPYAARHTFAQNAVDQGVPLDVVGEALGHRDPKTTMKYARVRSARVLEAIGDVVSPVQSALSVQAVPQPSPQPSPSKRKTARKGRQGSRKRTQGKSDSARSRQAE